MTVLMLILSTLLLRSGSWFGWVVLSGPILLLWGYLRYGTVHAAFQAHLQGDEDGVVRLLGQTRFTTLLRPQDKAYFEFLSGTVAQRLGSLRAAREHFLRAGQGPLRTDNMRSVIHCHLAAIDIEEGSPEQAATQLQLARDCPHRPATEQMIAALEERLAAAV